MKKLIYCAAALATALFAGSCQRELLDPAQDGSTVTFSVGIPELAGTKANANGIGNGADINNLVYAVYKTTSDETEAFANVKPGDLVYCINPLDPKGDENDEDRVYTYFNEKGEAHVSLELVKNQKYVVLFWAQHEQTWVSGEKFNLTDITYPAPSEENPRVANSNYYEAFCGAAYIDEVTASRSERATLTRPFAQINLATNNPEDYGVNIATSSVKVWGAADNFNVATMKATGTTDVEYVAAVKPAEGEFKGYEHYVAMNYIFANEKENNTQTVKVECTINSDFYANGIVTEIENVPVAQNYKTNILGNLLTSKVDYTVELVKDWNTPDYEVKVVSVSSAQELAEAFEALEENVEGESTNIKLDGDIDLNDLFSASTFSTKAANDDPSLTIPAGKSLVLDLNGKTLSATSTKTGKNYNMFNVKGTLTVKNGTIKYQHVGENMGWGASTNIFDVTAGGVLNLEGVTAQNLGGSDMGFVAHLNNWGEVTLNAENCTLESNYVPVRVFNSGPDMNNVTIKNSTLTGGSAAFWVHNYTVDDFGTVEKVESQKALLNLNIYNQGNTFSPDINGIRYGFTNSIRTDALGVTKKVSEDGTEVTLGAFLENVTVRRGVAGDEENTTITKVVVEEGVAVLYDRTFRRFYALEEVVLPSTLTTIGAAGSGVFQSCNNLKTIVIPESVKVLGKGSFQECSSLESINIPAGVTRIESDALRATGLKSVEFHAGVTYFGAQAFRDCKQLTEVVINAPEFTMENNTFGIMAAPFTPMTIHVANAEMKAYVESNLTAHAKTYITVVAPEVVDNTADLQVALAEGKKVVLANDLTITNDEGITAPYGNKTALSQKGGVFDGNGKTITSNILGDSYIYMTNGGTTKNVNITGAFRGIMVMSPTQTVYLDNVVSGGKGVVYAFNTGEGDSTQDLVATNCTFNGWSSWSLLKSATFTNCTFGQGSEYSNVYGRLLRPYINTVFDGCDFCSKCYIDLSTLVAEQMVTIKNCSVNGVKITAENWASLVAPEDTCGEGQISVELKNGTFLTAENVADYIVFE